MKVIKMHGSFAPEYYAISVPTDLVPGGEAVFQLSAFQYRTLSRNLGAAEEESEGCNDQILGYFNKLIAGCVESTQIPAKTYTIAELNKLADPPDSLEDGATYPWSFTDNCYMCGGVGAFLHWLQEWEDKQDFTR